MLPDYWVYSLSKQVGTIGCTRCTDNHCLIRIGADTSEPMAAAADDESVQSLPMLQLLVGINLLSYFLLLLLNPSPRTGLL